MHDLILHHYSMSPFAEKVRLMCGYKGLAWHSVYIPPVLPKPDVVALTGGYRKTPVLQVGADVYCDTALIARVLEARQPTPSLYPAFAPLAVPLAQWADGVLFQAAVCWAMQPAGVVAILSNPSAQTLQEFAADRAAMRNNAPRITLADGTVQLKAHLAALNAQLLQVAQAGPWLMGAAPCIADFSVGHCLWFIQRATPVAGLLDAYPAVSAWLGRLFAIGHGEPADMTSAQAIAVAAGAGNGDAATRHAPVQVMPGLGFDAGTAITVAATDYGADPVAGTLVGLTPDAVTLRRTDPRAGTVHVHFPRFGFQIKKDTSA